MPVHANGAASNSILLFFLRQRVAVLIFFLFSWMISVACGLDPMQMAYHLEHGNSILGTFHNDRTQLANWMGDVEGSTPIHAINVAGTHDTCTWNYTGPAESTFRTQDRSIFDQLNAGIRFLDIRFGLDENTNELRLYHAEALLSSIATLEDVLWGLYHFLDYHPTETLLVSMKVDHGPSSLSVQNAVHALITEFPVNAYWIQGTSLPPNLDAARKKIILFRRFGLDTESDPNLTPVGLNVASGWADNNADFSIPYVPGNLAFIEDLYQLNGDAATVPAATKVQTKFEAVTTHIVNSRASGNSSEVFISFASGFGQGTGDILSPRGLAEGNSTLQLAGINQLMDEWLTREQRRLRLGIILYDFFQSRPHLVRKTIGLSVEEERGD